MDARRDVRATPGFQAAPRIARCRPPPRQQPRHIAHGTRVHHLQEIHTLPPSLSRRLLTGRTVPSASPLSGRGCCGTNVPSTCTCLPDGSDMGLHGATPRVAAPPRSFRGAAPRVVGPYEAPDTWGVPYVCPGGSGEVPSGRCAMTCHAQEVAASPRKSIKNGESRAKAPLRRQLRAATAKVSAPRPR